MDELRTLIWVIVQLFKLVRFILRGVFRVVRGVTGKVRAARDDGPGGPATEPKKIGKSAPKKAARAPAPVDPAAARAAAERLRASTHRLTGQLRDLAARARALEARCEGQRLCAPFAPTVRDFVLPALTRAEADLRRATDGAALRPIGRLAAYLDPLLKLLSVMADQRSDDSLDELIDDADALADACYRPVVDYCRTSDVPLSSNRAATVFGDGCSPWLGRIDDPTGLAILHLPWKWMAEVHRWPAIAHEVGHDFYDSVAGLDAQLMERADLAEGKDFAKIIDGRRGVNARDVDRIVTRWRHELIADAFGVMMLGPAYAITTAAIFASPDDPAQALAVDTDEGEYEVHPPGHIRVATVCGLLGRMGYGALADEMEQRWRAQHGDPEVILLPTTAAGYLAVEDQPFIERALSLTLALQRGSFAALKGIPLGSMPGFDFGPREHQASLRTRDAFLSDARPRLTDARLLVAGAVLAWAERPADGVRLLRAARLAVGNLDLPVAEGAPARTRGPESARELIRDAILLDVLLTPPRASLLRR